MLYATVCYWGYWVLVSLVGIVLCAFFCMKDGGLLGRYGRAFELESWLSIMLRSAWEGWVPGVFWWSSIPLAGGRMLGQGMGGGFWEVFVLERVVGFVGM